MTLLNQYLCHNIIFFCKFAIYLEKSKNINMNKTYICPNCNSTIQLKENIVLTVQKSESQRGLVFLSAELGNYEIYFDKKVLSLKLGDKVEVFCPVCLFNLGVEDEYRNLAKVILIDEKGQKSDIYFSRIVGEEATFKVSGEKIHKFGADSSNYNYWGYSL